MIDDAMRKVTGYYKITEQDVIGTVKNKILSEARKMLVYMYRTKHYLPYRFISNKLNRSIPTLCNFFTEIDFNINNFPDLKEKFEAILEGDKRTYRIEAIEMFFYYLESGMTYKESRDKAGISISDMKKDFPTTYGVRYDKIMRSREYITKRELLSKSAEAVELFINDPNKSYKKIASIIGKDPSFVNRAIDKYMPFIKQPITITLKSRIND